jgi:2-methylcitrate dehydratase PrpD
VDNVTVTLAAYVTSAQLGSIPEEVRHQAKRTLLNFVGCAIGGALDESVSAALRALGGPSGQRAASVLGRPERCEFKLACLLNGISSAVYSFDDTHAEAVVHAGGPVGSALLALAETQPVSGADFLLAYLLGVETVCRVSKAISVPPASAGLGWIQTGLCAGIGAAAAVGKAIQLGEIQQAWAMGIAASQASGIRGLSRSMCFSLMAGHAARSGLEAALLAREGFTSSGDPLGTRYGFAECYAQTANLAAVTDELGKRFEILVNTFKPYPCGVVIHPAIDACLDLIAARPVAPAQIVGIDAEINPTSASLCDIRHPHDSSEAQMSLQHWVAAAICEQRAGVRQSRSDKLSDPLISALRAKVVIRPNSEIGRDGARASIKLVSGEVLQAAVQHCRGSQARPMTDREIEGKYRTQCIDRVPEENIAAIPPRIWAIEGLADCACIAELARGRQSA